MSGVQVIGLGMITSVGTRSNQVAAAIRAGTTRFYESEVYDFRGEPLITAVLRDRELASAGFSRVKDKRIERLAQLTSAAFHELLPQIPETKTPIPLLLGTAADAPKWKQPLDKANLTSLLPSTPLGKTIGHSELIPHGRASGLEAVTRGIELIDQGAHPIVIAGGVDSYTDPDRLKALDQEHRARCQGIMDGFTPGEGAGFVLLAAPDFAPKEQVLGRITGWAVGEEPGHRYSELPFRGDGLSSTIQQALKNTSQVQTVYAGMNGESMFFKEWGVSRIRLGTKISESEKLIHPADCIGDTGAAHGPIMAGCAIIGFHRGYTQPPALVFCSSDGPTRAAIVVEPP